MATVTLSFPAKFKKRVLDKHPEIKWSEVFRNMIIRKTELFKQLKARGDL